MKTPLKKLRGLGLHKHEPKERKDIRPLSKLDELAQASLEMQDMRDCYDGLLSAAAATANSAYEFSESLQEMGSCLLEKTALNDDEESGKVLLMLGKVQFDLQKHIDSYRAHIFQTITSPSESLLNELRTVEEMKRQCDEKRDVYEYMITRHREKGQSRSGKGEIFSMQQLQTARDEYDEEAAFYVFRSKSLKQGQSRSLLTQAARHHAAQLCFFKKAVKSLESVEPHVKLVTEHQHIDYQFSGLNDGDEAGDDDDNDSNYDDDDDDDDDGELSFDYGQNDPELDVSTPRKSMELDQVDITFPQVATVEAVKENLGRLHNNSFAYRARLGSQSAPIFAENKFDSAEKIREIRQSSTRKLQTYVLPTPVDMKSSISAGSGNPMLHKTQTTPSGRTRNLWHSSPLDPKRLEKVLVDEKLSRPTNVNAQAVLERNNTASTRLPPPSDGLLFSHQFTLSASDPKKLKIHPFSGPLTSKPWPTKLVSVEGPHLYSGPLLQTSQLPYTSPKASPSTSPTFMSSPKISELHELPRPPASSTSKSSRPEGLAGHSAPLGSRDQVLSLINKSVVSNVASPLPRPPLIISRSFSIPSSSPSVATSYASKPLKNRHSMEIGEGVDSPPLTPIDLSRNRPSSAASETVIRVVQIRGTHMNSLATP
ncbi:hypothetical protein F2P56_029738 [Juglans regia]|uniref:Uncharacterized protein At2g33490-like n=2 Tax=Juglans regia TaxID=51240 RepID=A0A2I4DHS8_JUGRE|nr:uncharacterized protein At2g33490-like [Juglans regia]KAF5449274.1 hypothetical protein F2P56_029738 [Juglans regia]